MTMRKQPPGPFLQDNTLAIQKDPMSYTLKMWKRYGDIYRFHFLFKPATVLLRPEYARQVLLENQKNYDKNISLIHGNRVLLGNGLFTNDGASWRQQRRLIQPTFHKQQVVSYAPFITQAVSELIEKLDANVGQVVDMPTVALQLTLRIFGLSFFRIDLDEGVQEELQSTFTRMIPLLAEYINIPFPPLNVPTSRNRRILQAVRTIDKTVYHLIQKHRENAYDDVLSHLIEARDETGTPMSDQQIRDEAITLLIAGHDTTGHTIAYTIYALSQQPEITARLQKELEILAGQPPTAEQIARLPYLGAVVQETLRLYPPSFALVRHAIDEDEIDGYYIPRNSIVFISPYVIQHHPDFWDDPERFDPERFLPERIASHPKLAFLPFGAGPRVCIGNSLALLEAQTAVAMLIQRFTFKLSPPDHPIVNTVAVTMRPKFGIPMVLTRR